MHNSVNENPIHRHIREKLMHPRVNPKTYATIRIKNFKKTISADTHHLSSDLITMFGNSHQSCFTSFRIYPLTTYKVLILSVRVGHSFCDGSHMIQNQRIVTCDCINVRNLIRGHLEACKQDVGFKVHEDVVLECFFSCRLRIFNILNIVLLLWESLVAYNIFSKF